MLFLDVSRYAADGVLFAYIKMFHFQFRVGDFWYVE